MSSIHQQLYQLCTQYLAERKEEIKQLIAEAQEAAASDTKSSAGDKYETGREMMQQEVAMALARIADLDRQQLALKKILPDQNSITIQPGSVVHTTLGKYYVAVSAGRLQAGGHIYHAISPASPIGAVLAGCQAGDKVHFNGKTIIVEQVNFIQAQLSTTAQLPAN